MLDIWGMLNVSVGLSVLQGQETDLNIGGIDRSLNDKPFLIHSFKGISSLPSEADKLLQIAALLGWTDPGPPLIPLLA